MTSFESELGSHYLSSFETRKLNPFPADYVSCLERLLDLCLLQKVVFDISKLHERRSGIFRIDELTNGLKNGSLEKHLNIQSEYFLSSFTTPKRKKTLVGSEQSAILEELVEYETAKQVHMRIAQKYKASFKRSPTGNPYYGLRTQNPELTKFMK